MLLLITGCVNVSEETPFVKVRDGNDRLSQYLQTIDWAINRTPFDTIVFCENSNCQFDFTGYVNENFSTEKTFEYITFQGDSAKCAQYGKGFGEGEIVDYAYRHSQYMKTAEEFYKVTGKLTVENIESMIESSSVSCFMRYCERVGKVDTKFYKLMMTDYLSGICDAYLNVRDLDNYFLEQAYFDCMKLKGIRFKSFQQVPTICGISGTTGRRYQPLSGKKERLYNWFCMKGIYNSWWMAYLDYFLKMIKF